MKNIVLIGFMGTGKTSVGKIIAEKLNFEFIDVDEVIERALGMKITEIFSKFGESRFRDVEEEVIKLITKRIRQVIATGGGVVLRSQNINRLKENGIIFCLQASEDVIYDRLKQTQDRPLLQVENPKERIRELLQNRKPLYEKADFFIDTERLTPEEVAEKIIIKYKEVKSWKN